MLDQDSELVFEMQDSLLVCRAPGYLPVSVNPFGHVTGEFYLSLSKPHHFYKLRSY